MDGGVSREELEGAFCWEDGDRLPKRAGMTVLRRRLRLQQARWREAQGHPIGTQPIVPTGEARPVGSRVPFDYGHETGANFVTPGALAAARVRTSYVEPHQTFDRRQLWADLLWAPTLAFNLFGDLAADRDRATRAVHTWWPDAPATSTVAEVRFAHSPGRLDPAYINSLVAFDAAFVLDLGDGRRGIVGIATKYADWLKPEVPKPTKLARYREIADRSGVFAPGATDQLGGRSPLAVTWLEHLLVLSMLQHLGGAWTWARYVVVHPAANDDVAAGCDRYRTLLADGPDEPTFATMTIEQLLDSHTLPPPTEQALRARYGFNPAG